MIADPRLAAKDGTSAAAIAARVGRADALLLFEPRGFAIELADDDALLGACARGDEAEQPGLLADAGAGNTSAFRLMLELGFNVASRTRHPGAPGGGEAARRLTLRS